MYISLFLAIKKIIHDRALCASASLLSVIHWFLSTCRFAVNLPVVLVQIGTSEHLEN